MWTLFEPIHAVTYFAPQAREHFEAVGLRGFWRGYFGGRAAPLGAVSAAPVVAAFFSFAAPFVARALPDVWTRATPERCLAARESGAVAALDALAGEADLSEAAALLTAAAGHADTAGRVLAAANTDLPVPSQPAAKLWHAATILREHRGDGHVAALLTVGLTGCEALVWRSSIDLDGAWLQAARGWTDDEWRDAKHALVERGWLTPEGEPTPVALEAQRDIEATTDRLAERPWRELGAAGTQRLAELLIPLAERAYQTIPNGNPIGVPPPARDFG
jgi:hypothetical protein